MSKEKNKNTYYDVEKHNKFKEVIETIKRNPDQPITIFFYGTDMTPSITDTSIFRDYVNGDPHPILKIKGANSNYLEKGQNPNFFTTLNRAFGKNDVEALALEFYEFTEACKEAGIDLNTKKFNFISYSRGGQVSNKCATELQGLAPGAKINIMFEIDTVAARIKGPITKTPYKLDGIDEKDLSIPKNVEFNLKVYACSENRLGLQGTDPQKTESSAKVSVSLGLVANHTTINQDYLQNNDTGRYEPAPTEATEFNRAIIDKVLGGDTAFIPLPGVNIMEHADDGRSLITNSLSKDPQPLMTLPENLQDLCFSIINKIEEQHPSHQNNNNFG